MQARFWEYVNGSPVRIKINTGETLCHAEGGPTDEGYSWTGRVWSFDGDYVRIEETTDARDCDGRFTSQNDHECRRRDLAAGHECDGITYPKWQNAGYSQRDYAAEAMGY